MARTAGNDKDGNNDPDNFIYTFFGNKENTTFRSICYPKEKTIIQEDAAWVPLFSRIRFYVTSDRLSGIKASWNGSVKNNYRNMSIE